MSRSSDGDDGDGDGTMRFISLTACPNEVAWKPVVGMDARSAA